MKLIAPLVGMFFRPPAQAIVENLPIGLPLNLNHEPYNPFDPNAIMVTIDLRLLPDQMNPKNWDSMNQTLALHGWDMDSLLSLCENEGYQFHLGYMARTHNIRALPMMQDPDHKAIFTLNPQGKPAIELTTPESPLE